MFSLERKFLSCYEITISVLYRIQLHARVKFSSTTNKRWGLDFSVYVSMGGAVAVHVAANKSLPSLAGLVVVDVVEVCPPFITC